MNWERVLKRYKELEDMNRHFRADFELAIIFGEYDLADYLEGAENLLREKGYLTAEEEEEIYRYCKPFRLYHRLNEKLA